VGSFLKNVRVRTKHAEKTRVGLCGQSAMFKVVRDATMFMVFLFVVPMC
jgi:hypothetical protein